MPTISDIRKQYPQYQDLSDQQLGDALYSKFYSDMPRSEFDQKLGLSSDYQQPPPPPGMVLDPATGAMIDTKAEASRESQGPLGAAANFGMTAMEGVPVLGGWLKNNIGGGDPVKQAIANERLSQFQEDNPKTAMGAKIAGAVAGTAPMVMAAPGVFGAGGGSLLARTGASALSGTALGGADSAVRSQGDPTAIRNGIISGLVAGAAAPGAGALIGKGARGVANALLRRSASKAAGMTPRAFGQLSRAANADAMTPNTIGPRISELGPDGMIMDLGPNLQRQAGAIAAKPGRGQEIVRKAIMARDKGANARIISAVDDTLGKAEIPSSIETAIKANQKALAPEYGAVLKNAKAVDTQPIADSLDSQVVNLRGPGQKAARSVRKMLHINGTDQLDPNPSTLLATRQAIDGMMATNADPNAARVMAEARKMIDDELSRAVPGIKKVDAKYAELARQNDALSRGQQVLDSGRTAPRPAELAAEVQGGAVPQGVLVGPSAVPLRLRQGARAEIDRIIGTNANDRVALQRLIKGEGDWNRDRLATLFGKDKADRIINVLDRERQFADTSQIVTRNSETAARQAAMNELSGGGGTPNFGAREGYMAGGMLGGARSLGIRGIEGVANALRSSGAGRNAESLATGLASPNHQQIVDALIRASRGAKVPQSQIDGVTRALLLSSPSAINALRR